MYMYIVYDGCTYMYVRVSTRGMFLAICPHRDTCRLATRKCRHVHFKQREMLSMSSSLDLAWHPISLSLSLSLSFDCSRNF